MTISLFKLYTAVHIDTIYCMRKLHKIFFSALFVLPNNVNAYITDRCDWQDCEALANGESSGFGLLVVIVIGFIIFLAK